MEIANLAAAQDVKRLLVHVESVERKTSEPFPLLKVDVNQKNFERVVTLALFPRLSSRRFCLDSWND